MQSFNKSQRKRRKDKGGEVYSLEKNQKLKISKEIELIQSQCHQMINSWKQIRGQDQEVRRRIKIKLDYLSIISFKNEFDQFRGYLNTT